MDNRESHVQLMHAVNLAESSVLDAWANLVEAYATLGRADVQLQAYRRLLFGAPPEDGRPPDQAERPTPDAG